MRRVTLLATCALILPVLSGGEAAPAPNPANPDASPAARLAKRADFGGIDDPKTTLAEALDALAKVYDVNFDVNEKAFKFEQVNEVLKTEIANPNPIPALKNARLDAALGKVLQRVPAPSGAVIMVRRDAIEITTGGFLRGEVWGENDRGPFLPLVHAGFSKIPLEEALKGLADQADFNVVLDNREGVKGKTPVTARFRNTPLDTAVALVADMAELRTVLVNNVLYVTAPENARALEGRLNKQPRKEEKGTWAWPPSGSGIKISPVEEKEEPAPPRKRPVKGEEEDTPAKPQKKP